MWKQRIIALVLIVLAAGLGYFVFWSQSHGNHQFKLGLDLSGGSYLTYQADVSKLDPTDIGTAMDSLRLTIERRAANNLKGGSLGGIEPTVTTQTTTLAGNGKQYQLVVQLPGITDLKNAIAVIGQTPLLQFETQNPNFGITNGQKIQINASDIKNGQIDLSSALANLQQFTPTSLTGQYLSRASLEFDPTTHAPTIALQFNAQGAQMFADITAANVGKPVAIYLDGSPLSEPVVQQKITGGQAVITGNFTPQVARTIVSELNSGALPVPISLISTSTIGPTLGANAIRSGILAGLIGLIAIAVLLIGWYRIPGIIATLTLIGYAIVMLTLFKVVPVTITAPGIAGFIISLGMAVDANILIFERMKEQLHSGKTLAESIRHGFERAWTSIRDGNISSIISSVILFWFGTALIKGFALTFGLGVIVSMIMAYVVSRIVLLAVAGNGNGRIKRFLFSSGLSK
jgi:preprotein translocase subunit SecD